MICFWRKKEGGASPMGQAEGDKQVGIQNAKEHRVKEEGGHSKENYV